MTRFHALSRNSIVEEYLAYEKKTNPRYYRTVEKYAEAVGRINLKQEVVVAIPVHATEPSIKNTLNLYEKQTFLKNLFKIVLFINRRPLDPPFDHIIREIVNFQKESGLDIHYFCEELPNFATIGYIRKLLVDTIIRCSNARSDLIIVNTDADIDNLGETYLQEVQDLHTKEVRVSYALSDLPAWIDNYPKFSFLLRFYREVERIRNLHNHESLPARVYNYSLNFASETYTSVGGYNPLCVIAEDLTLALAIHNKFGKTSFQCLQTPISVSQRRQILTFANSLPLFYAWTDFTASKVRELPREDLRDALESREKNITWDNITREIELFLDYALQNHTVHFRAPQEGAATIKSIFRQATKNLETSFSPQIIKNSAAI